jgi:SAM-dependent methyltransferase
LDLLLYERRAVRCSADCATIEQAAFFAEFTVNRIHRWLCKSEGWKRSLREQIVPWVLNDIDLGSNVLEIGPGPGLTTDLLRSRSERLTALEIDEQLATSLEQRMSGTNVAVIRGDATTMPFEDASFSGAVAFTMLHHVPSAEKQDQLLREVRRVLRPGAIFAGTDGIRSLPLRLLHIADTYVPIDPAKFAPRLETAGFRDVRITDDGHRFRFQASRA